MKKLSSTMKNTNSEYCAGPTTMSLISSDDHSRPNKPKRILTPSYDEFAEVPGFEEASLDSTTVSSSDREGTNWQYQPDNLVQTSDDESNQCPAQDDIPLPPSRFMSPMVRDDGHLPPRQSGTSQSSYGAGYLPSAHEQGPGSFQQAEMRHKLSMLSRVSSLGMESVACMSEKSDEAKIDLNNAKHTRKLNIESFDQPAPETPKPAPETPKSDRNRWMQDVSPVIPKTEVGAVAATMKNHSPVSPAPDIDAVGTTMNSRGPVSPAPDIEAVGSTMKSRGRVGPATDVDAFTATMKSRDHVSHSRRSARTVGSHGFVPGVNRYPYGGMDPRIQAQNSQSGHSRASAPAAFHVGPMPGYQMPSQTPNASASSRGSQLSGYYTQNTGLSQSYSSLPSPHSAGMVCLPVYGQYHHTPQRAPGLEPEIVPLMPYSPYTWPTHSDPLAHIKLEVAPGSELVKSKKLSKDGDYDPSRLPVMQPPEKRTTPNADNKSSDSDGEKTSSKKKPLSRRIAWMAKCRSASAPVDAKSLVNANAKVLGTKSPMGGWLSRYSSKSQSTDPETRKILEKFFMDISNHSQEDRRPSL